MTPPQSPGESGREVVGQFSKATTSLRFPFPANDGVQTLNPTCKDIYPSRFFLATVSQVQLSP